MNDRYAKLPEAVWRQFPVRERVVCFVAQSGGVWFGRLDTFAERIDSTGEAIRSALRRLRQGDVVQTFATYDGSGRNGFLIFAVPACFPTTGTMAEAVRRKVSQHHLRLRPVRSHRSRPVRSHRSDRSDRTAQWNGSDLDDSEVDNSDRSIALSATSRRVLWSDLIAEGADIAGLALTPKARVGLGRWLEYVSEEAGEWEAAGLLVRSLQDAHANRLSLTNAMRANNLSLCDDGISFAMVIQTPATPVPASMRWKEGPRGWRLDPEETTT